MSNLTSAFPPCKTCDEQRGEDRLLDLLLEYVDHHRITFDECLFHACNIDSCGLAHVKERAFVLGLDPQQPGERQADHSSRAFRVRCLTTLSIEAIAERYPETQQQKAVHEGERRYVKEPHVVIGTTCGWVLFLLGPETGQVPLLVPFEVTAFADVAFSRDWSLTAMLRLSFGVFPRRSPKQSMQRLPKELYRVWAGAKEGQWEEVLVTRASPLAKL